VKLSRRGEYALRAVRNLAARHGGEPVATKTLADQEKIPRKFLEQVLLSLRNSGLLTSVRGKEGGYVLRKPPREIRLGDVIRSVDGPLAPVGCASRTQPRVCRDCPYPPESCFLRAVMLEVRDSISSVMDRITLADLVTPSRKARRAADRRPRLG
jgi:Rrf2 family protein